MKQYCTHIVLIYFWNVKFKYKLIFYEQIIQVFLNDFFLLLNYTVFHILLIWEYESNKKKQYHILL